MALLGQGVLAIWNGISEEAEEEFYRWHNTEHMPERLGVPGFLRGRRYLSAARPRDFFTLYETEDPATLSSAPYLARLNKPTPWTRRMLRHFRDAVRVGCRVLESRASSREGAAILTVRLRPRTGCEETLRSWLTGRSLTLMNQRPGIFGVHVLEPVAAPAGLAGRVRLLRRFGARRQLWVLLVECSDGELAEALTHAPVDVPELAVDAGAQQALASVYRLQISLSRG